MVRNNIINYYDLIDLINTKSKSMYLSLYSMDGENTTMPLEVICLLNEFHHYNSIINNNDGLITLENIENINIDIQYVYQHNYIICELINTIITYLKTIGKDILFINIS